MSKRLLAAIAVVVLVAVGAFFLAEHGPQPAAKPAPAAVPRASETASPTPQPPPETRVHRVSRAEHEQLAERIAAARARARQAAAVPSPSPAGSDDDDSITLEQVSPAARAALEASIPILAECYHDKQPKQTAVVMMTLYSDPSVGMVIDTEEMTDDEGSALPPALDDCLRTAIETLALPPLEVGGHLPVQYSFQF